MAFPVPCATISFTGPQWRTNPSRSTCRSLLVGGSERLAISVSHHAALRRPRQSRALHCDACRTNPAARSNSRSSSPTTIRVAGSDEVSARLRRRRARGPTRQFRGAGAARNAAVAASRGRILAFIDSDCRPSAKLALSAALPPSRPGQNSLADRSRVVLRGPRPIRPPSKHSSACSLSTSSGTSRRKGVHRLTANSSIPRDIFERVGVFRPKGGRGPGLGQARRRVRIQLALRSRRRRLAPGPTRLGRTPPRKWRRITLAEAYAVAIEKPNGRANWVAFPAFLDLRFAVCALGARRDDSQARHGRRTPPRDRGSVRDSFLALRRVHAIAVSLDVTGDRAGREGRLTLRVSDRARADRRADPSGLE